MATLCGPGGVVRGGGAFERATGRFPFALPKTWLDKRKELDLQTPFNFVADNDIVVNCVLQDPNAPLIFVTEDDLAAMRTAAKRGGSDPNGYLTQQVQAFGRDYGRLIDTVRGSGYGFRTD